MVFLLVHWCVFGCGRFIIREVPAGILFSGMFGTWVFFAVAAFSWSSVWRGIVVHITFARGFLLDLDWELCPLNCLTYTTLKTLQIPLDVYSMEVQTAITCIWSRLDLEYSHNHYWQCEKHCTFVCWSF